MTKILNPTIHFHVGYFNRLPFPEDIKKHSDEIISLAKEAVSLSANDWNGFERSWEFKKNPLVAEKKSSLRDSFIFYKNNCYDNFNRLYEIEFKNNKLFLDLYKLQDEFNACPDASTISLDVNPLYRYGSSLKPEQYQARFCSDSIVELLSYNIGCQMGRYSLDREGLVYAHEGSKGFTELVAEGAYKTFPADNDGILPLMDDEWFDDDITSRVKEFVRTVWGEEHLQENLEFIAESLCLYAIKPKKGESALDTIRRYLSTQFWKDHLKMYKKRPIYWLFSSGKEKAFECLVYLHRYNDATLARMRTEYVVPLLARYQANIDRLNEQVDGASGGEATRLKRERDSLSKKFNELRSFDDRLRHYADMRISIDLDDGVKVNYGKFGDLLADVKAITGNAPEVI
ncbi:TPA: class I SAM-dependent DNA methyltransferase [Klebsiella pneumoniae]|nr:class I SAM-dependent DNA methyltransferase [Klebsiella pneumoniae]